MNHWKDHISLTLVGGDDCGSDGGGCLDVIVRNDDDILASCGRIYFCITSSVPGTELTELSLCYFC